jgi:hypothetical protein
MAGMNTWRTEAIASFFEGASLRLHRCLAPGMLCKETAIRSHSVQNSRVLDLLARDGHVKGLGKRIEGDPGPVIRFENVGRNQATTFTGFCSKHDYEIFRPIERDTFRPTDPEHLFLVAYRAVARELHACMEATVQIQAGYNARIRHGLDSGNEPEPVGMFAVEYMIKSWLTYRYKCCFDEALLSKEYDKVSHDVIHLTHASPTLAVCSLYAADDVLGNDDWIRIALNLLPLTQTESAVVFSYLPREAALARASLTGILNSTSFSQKYLLSKHILNHCDNFVVSPGHFDTWSREKVDAIIDFFCETLFKGNLSVEDERLYLF